MSQFYFGTSRFVGKKLRISELKHLILTTT